MSTLAFTLMLAGICSAQSATPFSCPATLLVIQRPQPEGGWSGASSKAEHAFKTAKIYNGHAGKEEYDLKPDSASERGRKITLRWNLKDYRAMNLFIRCFYHDSDATVTANLPAPLATCAVSLEFNAKNEIIGASVMSCLP
jgi:hypothetical protein